MNKNIRYLILILSGILFTLPTQAQHNPMVNGILDSGADIASGWESVYPGIKPPGVHQQNPTPPYAQGGSTGSISTKMSNQVQDYLYVFRYAPGRIDEISYGGLNVSSSPNYPSGVVVYSGNANAYFNALGIAQTIPSNSDIKVILTFPFQYGAAGFSSNDTTAKTEYADYVEAVLGAFYTAGKLSYVKAIEIGAEEEAGGRWTDADGYYTHFGSTREGEKFAEMYLAVKDRLDATSSSTPNLSNIPIISTGSVEKHATINSGYNTATDSGGVRWGSAKSFIEGFVNYIYTNRGVSDLPDIVGIHGYMGEWNPEFRVVSDPLTPLSFWPERLKELRNICEGATSGAWDPDYCITEYGYDGDSSIGGNVYSHLDGSSGRFANEYTQSVNFLRTQLMNASTVSTVWSADVGWKYSTYFHHTYDSDDQASGFGDDVGFFNYVPSPGTTSDDRYARIVARFLYNDLKLNNTSLLIQPIEFEAIGTDYMATCGWELSDGRRVYAVWRFKPTDLFYDPTPVSQSKIELEGDLTGYSYSAIKFNYPNANFASVSVTSFSPSSSYTEVTVAIDENPVFVVVEP